jgi:hypothetical protein
MDFNLIETFNDNCGISVGTGDITTKECKQYSDESYKTLRNNYLDTILEKFIDSDASNKECIIKLLYDNILTSKGELENMVSETTQYKTDMNASIDSLDSNIDLDELENNVLLSEQRIKETDELLYINNIKYYGIIVSLIIILIIELILIKL